MAKLLFWSTCVHRLKVSRDKWNSNVKTFPKKKTLHSSHFCLLTIHLFLLLTLTTCGFYLYTKSHFNPNIRMWLLIVIVSFSSELVFRMTSLTKSRLSSGQLVKVLTQLSLTLSSLTFLTVGCQLRSQVHIITNEISDEEVVFDAGKLAELMSTSQPPQMIPIVVNTWGFSAAAEEGI
jgi:hypothetical protein